MESGSNALPHDVAKDTTDHLATVNPEAGALTGLGAAPVTHDGTATRHGAPPMTHALAVAASHQIAEAAAQTPERPIELSLAPEELGKVRIVLHSHHNAITVSVQAERPETLDLLRRNIDLLAQDFRELGYSELSFSFGGDPGPSRDQPPAPPADLSSPVEPAAPQLAAAAQSTLPTARYPSAGLDLRI